MKEMNVTQEYYLCAINEKGTLSSLNTYVIVCLVASGLLELKLYDCICIEYSTVSVKASLPNECSYLSPLYEYIKSGQSRKINKIIESYTSTGKKINELINSIERSFTDEDMFNVVSVGIMKKKEKLVPTLKTKTNIVQKIRAELLDDGNITDEVAILTVLLDRAGFLKIYFSKFERKNIKEKIKKLLESPYGKIVKQMMEYVDMSIAVIAVLAT